MVKKRIIPVLLYSKGRVIKSRQFCNFRDVGHPLSAAKVYYSQDADELILLNIDRDIKDIEDLCALTKKITSEVFLPITVGGGIYSLLDAQKIINAGADKVVLNSILYEHPEVITEISNIFGSQSVVVGVDVRKFNDQYVLYSHNGAQKKEICLLEHIKKCEALGAGEFFVQSIDHDGCMEGFDLELLNFVASSLRKPVIGCGGSGSYEHLLECFLRTQVQALACGSLFNFSDSNPIRAAAFLKNSGVDVKVI